MNAAFHDYPVRDESRPAFADRMVQRTRARFQRMFEFACGDPAEYLRQIGRIADMLRGEPLPERILQLRYRLRRDGYTDLLIRESLALCSVGLERNQVPWPAAISFAAAAEQLRGGLVAVTNDDDRSAALALAATAATLNGEPVHVLARSDARAIELSLLLGQYGKAMGIGVAAVVSGMDFSARREAYGATVVCSTTQAVGLDYLRDRLKLGVRQGRLAHLATRLSGDAPTEGPLLLRGLHGAYVDGAEQVMIDDSRLPLVIAAEVEQSGERLLYEQALELARALDADRDFALLGGEPVLTEDGRRRLALLVSPLGGIWAARSRCEDLIVIALRALHEFLRDRDYRVMQGRVVFPPPAGKEREDRSEGDEMLQKLTEVKEGCALSSRREVLARISVPRFFNSYLRLAGVCSGKRQTADELWSLYGLRVTGEDLPQLEVSCRPQIFATAQVRLNALVRHAAASSSGGYAVMIAVRSQQEGRTVAEGLAAAGIQAAWLRGRGDDADRKALAGLGQPGAVAIVCHPAEPRLRRDLGSAPLHLLVPELHDARRHLEMLCRSCFVARCEILLSLEDEAVKSLLPAALATWVRRRIDGHDEVSIQWSHWLTRYIQAAMEREQRLLREELMSRDAYLGDLMAFSGRHD